jgi:hypothetical protein
MGRVGQPSEERSTRRVWSSGATWVSAGAAALSAVVAAIALVVNADGGDAEKAAPRSDVGSTSVSTAVDRSVAIDAVAFVENEPGPRYAFRGTARIDDEKEAVYVLARPVFAADEAASAASAPAAENWISSPPALLEADGTWTTSIRQPPLPGGEIEFVPIVMDAGSSGSSTSGRLPSWAANASAANGGGPSCPSDTSLRADGPEYCKVLEAGDTQSYAP